ncbi:hypothetical protein PLICRDRAFT_155111 [Plicaturopsis crispa FD-325 SS-3]|nr:hypothetical protein PLICRDRAFT_155111 [Plicaturopsis crispa FD-325 SS-3]
MADLGHSTSDNGKDHIEAVTTPASQSDEHAERAQEVKYRLYKWRFAGIVGMVLLNIVSAMGWTWFAPIANNVSADFGITLDEVNWLGNLFSCTYLPISILIPAFCRRYGFRRCCDVGAASILIGAWVRYAGTAHSLSKGGAYALLFISQFIASISQPIFQVLGPKYSETWFDLQGRTTATMIIAISNPIGSALGQLLSPLVGSSRQSILVLAIIATVIAPTIFLIGSSPPTPPTYAASRTGPSMLSLIYTLLGIKYSAAESEKRSGADAEEEMTMTGVERVDFAIVTVVFAILVAAINTFSLLTAQVLQPVGYSADTAGFMGATLLLTGIVAAIVTAPLFDRVLTHHLALTAKILVPIMAASWVAFIFAVKPGDKGGLYVIMTLVGTTGVTLLPVALELGCELTRSAESSSAILWFSGNLFGLMFVLVEGALRAPASATPPLNMRKALIFNAAFVCGAASIVFFLRGHQTRRRRDEEKIALGGDVEMVMGREEAGRMDV